MKPLIVTQISESFIKPENSSEESKQPIILSPWDLTMLSVHYIQNGLLFKKHRESDQNSMHDLLTKLKSTLSATLVQFYPLAGQLSTIKEQNPDSQFIFLDPQKGPGARFVHARVNATLNEVLEPKDVPLIFQSFFDHDRAVNHDGHSKSLLTIQVTELVDGIFIGCSLNHAVGDGTAFWHFLNSWAEVFQSGKPEITRKPIHTRLIPGGGCAPIVNLPYGDENQFISRFESPILRERFFHFSVESLKKLKKRANRESNQEHNKISSFQALSALLWRCITRSRNFPSDQITGCRLAINNRSRLNPNISPNYFGNCIQTVRGVAKCGELLEQNLGRAAVILHEAVTSHTDKAIRDATDEWFKKTTVYQMGQLFDPSSVMMGNSPRFDMYGNEFGLGKPLCIRSGYGHKSCGKVSSYPGFEGGGSIDCEICLRPEFMEVFESDEELLEYASFSDFTLS